MTTDPVVPTGPTTSRRRFLRWVGAGALTGAAAATGIGVADRLRADGTAGPPPGPPPPTTAATRSGRTTELVLVTIQLDGGLDFLNTVVPTDARYQDVRRGGTIADDRLLTLDGDFSMNAAMPHLAEAWGQGQLAIVHGVGLPDNSLSHFVDTDVWARGRPEVGDGTGWLGRALDDIQREPDPLSGISSGELSPTLYAPGWSAVALPEDGRLPWSANFVRDNPGLVAAHQTMLRARGRIGAQMSLAEGVRQSQQLVRDVADTVSGATDLERVAAAADLLDGDDVTDHLSGRLRLVSDLITGGLTTRVFHLRYGEFDTHAEQEATFDTQLSTLDSAIAEFRASLGGHADRVVIATWTEFGRRPDWNGSGTDHGTAGTHFVLGPTVRGGHHGDPVSLRRFDDDDNFLVTTDFRSYLGGLTADVLDADPAVVVPGRRPTMELIT